MVNLMNNKSEMIKIPRNEELLRKSQNRSCKSSYEVV